MTTATAKEGKWLVIEELRGSGKVGVEWFEREGTREEVKDPHSEEARESGLNVFVVDAYTNVVVGSCGMCGKEEKSSYWSTVRVTEEDGTQRLEHNVRGCNRAKDEVVRRLDKRHGACK